MAVRRLQARVKTVNSNKLNLRCVVITLMVQKYGQTVLLTGEMIVDGI